MQEREDFKVGLYGPPVNPASPALFWKEDEAEDSDSKVRGLVDMKTEMDQAAAAQNAANQAAAQSPQKAALAEAQTKLQMQREDLDHKATMSATEHAHAVDKLTLTAKLAMEKLAAEHAFADSQNVKFNVNVAAKASPTFQSEVENQIAGASDDAQQIRDDAQYSAPNTDTGEDEETTDDGSGSEG